MMRSAALPLLALLLASSAAQTRTNCQGSRADIFFLIDASGSVGEENFQLTLDFVVDFARAFTIAPLAVQIGAATFSDDLYPQFDLNEHLVKADLLSAIKSIPYATGNTYTDDALIYGYTQAFSASNGGRSLSEQFLIVLTDGKSTNPSRLRAVVIGRSTNITTIAIGIGSGVDSDELELIASTPQDVFNVNSFAVLNSILENLKSGICETVVDGKWSGWSKWTGCSKSCGGGQQTRSRTCTEPKPSGGGADCDGPPKEERPCNTQECPNTDCPPSRADIVVLIDASGSVGKKNFDLTLNFVKDFADAFTIGPRNMQLGMATFASALDSRFYLNENQDKDDLLQDILSTPYSEGSTNTHIAIRYAYERAFRPGKGDREDAPNILIVLTDGKATEPDDLQDEVKVLRTKDITTYAIGVGSGIDYRELELIASSPKNVLNVTDYQALDSIQDDLKSSVCRVPPETPRAPKCSFSRDLVNGDFQSVTVKGQTDKVTPEAKCSFYRMVNGGRAIPIRGNITYKHTRVSAPNYFRTFCSVQVSLKELGEGTHTFMVFIFPNVSGGRAYVNATRATGNLVLSLPRVNHSCPPSLVKDYLCGKPTRCKCFLEDDGYPKGRAVWFSQGRKVAVGELNVTYDSAAPVLAYTCEGMSTLGRTFGSELKLETTCG